MPGTLTILCNVERVAALDLDATAIAPRKLAFGLNLSVAWENPDDPGTRPPAGYLSPWKWSAIDTVRITFRKADATLVDFTARWIDRGVQAPATDLTDWLDAGFAATPVSQLRLPSTGSSVRVTDDNKPWAPRLLHLSTFPFPLPQSLNLNLLFYVGLDQIMTIPDNTDQSTIDVSKLGQLWAAPVLKAGGPFSAERAPVRLTAVQDDLQWDYAGSAPLICAAVRGIGLKPAADGFVDLSTQWVFTPDRSAVPEDWQAQLEPRMAEAFRLCEFLADFLRQNATNAVFNVDRYLAQLSAAAIATLADCAGTGLVRADQPQDRSFAERLVRVYNQENPSSAVTISSSDWIALELRSRTLYASWDKWAQQLANSLPVLNSLELLQGRPLTAAQAHSQFQRVLEQMFASPKQANLWKLFRDQWELLMQSSALTPAQVAGVLRAIDWHAQNLRFDIRARLAISSLDRYWDKFVASNLANDKTGSALIDFCFEKYLRYYGAVRLNLPRDPDGLCKLPADAWKPLYSPPAPPLPDAKPGQPNLKAMLAAALTQRATDFKDQLRPPKPAPSQTPKGITVPLGRVGSDSAAESNLSQNVTGFVVLMRQHGKDPNWHCLNYAEPWLAAATRSFRADPIVVPSRPGYRGGLRQAMLTYDNQSIAADSPLAETALVGRYVQSAPYSEAFMRFRYCGASSPDTPPQGFVRTPALIYGESYDVCAFAMTNSGVPPKTLLDAGRGWDVARTIPDNAVPSTAIIKVPYKRWVPVGALRLVAPDRTRESLRKSPVFPDIPDNVTPRAREYETLAPPPPGAPDTDKGHKGSVILLSPGTWTHTLARNSCTLQVLPATVGWNCWDRWMAARSDLRDQRIAAIAETYRQIAAAHATNIKQDPDLQLDDPALEPRARIELQIVNGDGSLSSRGSSWAAFGAPGDGPLSRFQRAPFAVTCVLDESEGIDPQSSAGGEIKVHIKKGQLYRLALFAAVTKANADRFGDDIFKDAATLTDGGEYRLVSPNYLLLEGATEEMPTEKQIWDAAKCTFQVQGGSGGDQDLHRIRVEVNPFAVASNPTSFRYLHRAEILHQAWRWTGRPVDPHPEAITAAAPGALAREVRAWEAVEFGDRLDAENIPHPMAVVREPNAATRAANPLRYASDIRSYRFDVTPCDRRGRYDERGQHHRFAIRCYSRYEGLMTLQANSRRALEAIPDGSGQVDNQWLRLYVPSTRKDPLPVPKIKLILPLTQSEPEDSLHKILLDNKMRDPLKSLEDSERAHGVAGLLVVLNEPWFECGGIGEGIQARVEMAPSPTDGPKLFYYQIGPDATANILDVGKQRKLIDYPVPPDDQTIGFDTTLMIGPVGHYFDSNNTTALFVGTSFVLPPPKLPPPKDAPLPWYFARMSMRRTLDTRQPPNSPGAQEYPSASWPHVVATSEFSDPLWVQFLPEFSRFDGFGEHVSGLRLVVDQQAKRARLLTKSGAPATLAPTRTDSPGVFTLYLVLTRMVVDVLARPDQETYVTVMEQNGDAWTPLGAEFDKLAQRPYDWRARVIEVQRPGPPTGGDLWDELFAAPAAAGQQPVDSKARIVRVSEPIDSRVVALNCEG